MSVTGSINQNVFEYNIIEHASPGIKVKNKGTFHWELKRDVGNKRNIK